MKKINIPLALLILFVLATGSASLSQMAPVQDEALSEYLTFWSGDLRIFSLTGNTRITIYDLDTGLPLEFADSRIDSTNFPSNPFDLDNVGDSFEGVGGLGPADQEIRVRIASSDALGGDADRPIFVWTGSLEPSARHPAAAPETDNPWMSYLFGLPETGEAVAFSRELGREFLGFTTRELYVFAQKGPAPTSIVIEDLVTNTDSDNDDSQTLGPADAVYTDSEIEIYYLDQFEDDTITISSNVDISALVGVSSGVHDDWTATPPSYGPDDDGFEKGTLFYTYVSCYLTVFPLEDDTTVTITDLSDGDDNKTITLANGDTSGDYGFYTPVLESATESTGEMVPRPSSPAVTIFSNNENPFDHDFVKVESDKPILVYVGPVASDWQEFADFAYTVPDGPDRRIAHVYAQNSGDSNDFQVFAFDATTVVTITSLSRTADFKDPVWHDFVIGPGIGGTDGWLKGTTDGGVWWGSEVWSGEVLRVESDNPIVVLNGDYDTPHFGAFVPFFAQKVGSITIEKEVRGVDAQGMPFDFTFDGTGFSLTDGQSTWFGDLAAGTYTVAEIVPYRWLLAEIKCDNGTVLPNPVPPEVVIDLAPGEDVVCRFTNEYPTAVDLLSFTAHAGADNVTLNWQTASELDTEGFNVWRSRSQGGPYTQVNASLIAARGNADTGASYEYTDTDVEQDVTYFYKLEDVDGSGISTYHGPVSATPTRTWQISLPFISGGIVFSKRRMRRRKMRRA